MNRIRILDVLPFRICIDTDDVLRAHGLFAERETHTQREISHAALGGQSRCAILLSNEFSPNGNQENLTHAEFLAREVLERVEWNLSHVNLGICPGIHPRAVMFGSGYLCKVPGRPKLLRDGERVLPALAK